VRPSEQLHPILAAEIAVDLRAPLGPDVAGGIVASMDRFPVGVFRNVTPLSDAEHVRLAGGWGRWSVCRNA